MPHDLRPEHVGPYDQNHRAATVNLNEMVRIHREHTEADCSQAAATACLTSELLKMDPFALAVILGVAVERLAER